MAHQVQSGLATSTYSHKNKDVVLDGKPHYAFNCYGFIDHLLRKTHPSALQEVIDFMEEMRDVIPPSIDGMPCPYNYWAFFEALKIRPSPCWKLIDSFEELESGDVIAYVGPDYVHRVIDTYPSSRTGTHMLIVDKVFGQAKGMWHFSIIDCTRAAHNRVDDSRWKGKHGVGQCSLYLCKEKGETYVCWHEHKRLKKVTMARLI